MSSVISSLNPQCQTDSVVFIMLLIIFQSPTKKLRKLPFCLFSNDVEFQKKKQDQRGKPLIIGTFSESLLFLCELCSKLCFVRCLSCVLNQYFGLEISSTKKVKYQMTTLFLLLELHTQYCKPNTCSITV